jgi:hypothetical protein
MDDHGHTYDQVTNTCGYVDTSLAIMLALLDSPRQKQRLLACTPSQRVRQVIPSLLSPVTSYPCSESDTGRQLLKYHLVVIAATAETEYPSSAITEVYMAPWFTPWNLPMAQEHVHNSLLPSIDLLSPQEQGQDHSTGSNKRTRAHATGGTNHPAKKPRPNMTLDDADMIPLQWEPKAPKAVTKFSDMFF